MGTKADQSYTYQPLRLLRNFTYPTYQLYAIAGFGKKTPAEDVLKIAILETLQWLRRRFRDFEIPSFLDWPEADCYDQVDLQAFASFQIDEGYKVEVVWLPEERIWAMQLTEPDLGPNPGAEGQSRLPVPGRLFETNIAYRIMNGQVECGFKTVVSDLEGTRAPCEVYRLSVIKYLARNPLVGLSQGYFLSDAPLPVDSVNKLRDLADWLKDEARMMPSVIIAEPERNPMAAMQLPSLDDLVSGSLLDRQIMLDLPTLGSDTFAANAFPDKTAKAGNEAAHPLDVARLAHDQMGYAQVFLLPVERLEAFRKSCGKVIAPGDVLVLEPPAFGGGSDRISYAQVAGDPDAVFNRLGRHLHHYPKDKAMDFGQIVWLPAAKTMERQKILDLSHSKEDILRLSEEAAREAEARYRAELRGVNELCAAKDEKIRRQAGQIQALEATEKQRRQDQLAELERQYRKEMATRDAEIARLKSLLNRPRSLGEVPRWAEEYLKDGLILHPRAKKELDDVAPNEVNLPLLCDALEFLATDYRDELLGLIDGPELQLRCAGKYNRGFEVTPVTGTSVEMYPTDYKIKYHIGFKGKPVESTLDLHLKVGDSGKILRIYFLYDKEKKLVVVGSLPRHLRTVSYK